MVNSTNYDLIIIKPTDKNYIDDCNNRPDNNRTDKINRWLSDDLLSNA